MKLFHFAFSGKLGCHAAAYTLYTVRTEEGVKLGEVDEEFVYETQKGDRFILGSFAWRVRLCS